MHISVTESNAESLAMCNPLARLSRMECLRDAFLLPLIFLIFINDFAEVMPPETSVDIFTDDTTPSASAPLIDFSDLCAHLPESTRALESWSNNNRFKLNTGKTKAMVVSDSRLLPKIDVLGMEMEINKSDDVVLE